MVESASFNGRISRAAFFTAFLFALLSSGSLLCQRLAEGRFALGWLCSAAVTGGAMFLVVSASAPGSSVRRTPLVWRAHLFGVAIALALVHLAIFALSRGRRLTERPAQVVNDVVLVATTLGFVWSMVSRAAVARSILPLASFGVLAGYAASMASWHVDPFPGLQIQHFVVQQVMSTSAALLIFFFADGMVGAA